MGLVDRGRETGGEGDRWNWWWGAGGLETGEGEGGMGWAGDR